MSIALEDRDAAGEFLQAPNSDIDVQRIELHRETARPAMCAAMILLPEPSNGS
ncbi:MULTISPECIES: hypothetical protein [unclassified Afipia]|uniref:hypothetical protein n=1 Tax=unclassified Afipia TaxID=2642050 RepID=UPI001FCB2D30|nr:MULTISPECIES: hypothetical protein [unclassified Afipia]